MDEEEAREEGENQETEDIAQPEDDEDGASPDEEEVEIGAEGEEETAAAMNDMGEDNNLMPEDEAMDNFNETTEYDDLAAVAPEDDADRVEEEEHADPEQEERDEDENLEDDNVHEQEPARDDDEMSNITPEDVFGSSDDDSDDDNDMFLQEEEAIEALNTKLAALQAEKEKSDQTNAELQRKAAYILTRIGRDTQSRGPDAASDEPNPTDNSGEKETQYLDTLTAIAEGRTKLLQHQSEYDQLALDLQSRLDDKEFKAEEIRDSLYQFKREILTKAENSRTGKGISKRLMKHYDISEQKKDSELEKVRLRNIGLRTTLKKLEKSLRSREQLAEGLHMIDFEQLKIENQTLNEKIEERNEELAKLKRKKTVTVQILTHIREKLRYVKTQEMTARADLAELDQQIIELRSHLTGSKHDRDVIREENVELRRQRGFATSDQLIVDFEKRRTTIESLEIAIKELQERHFLLTKQISTYNDTIKKNTESKGNTLFPPIKQY